MSTRTWKFYLFAAALTGCLGSGPKPYPLYAGEERSPSEVATLIGPVDFVDGRPVAEHGRLFTVEPGCHIVRPAQRWDDEEYSQSYMTARLGSLHFSLLMHAGCTYKLELKTGPFTGGGTANATLQVTELNREHRPITKYMARAGEGEPSACTAWAKGSMREIAAE